MSKSKATLAREAYCKEKALTTLHAFIKPGSTVYTTVMHVSRSGMFRVIKVVVTDDDGAHDLSGFVARAIGSKFDQRGGVAVGGCGMDMGFHVVYNLSRAMFADGFPCTGSDEYGSRCPSNDHSNERVRDFTPGRMHSDPGYALNHRWL
jgi:hypothetical protein